MYEQDEPVLRRILLIVLWLVVVVTIVWAVVWLIFFRHSDTATPHISTGITQNHQQGSNHSNNPKTKKPGTSPDANSNSSTDSNAPNTGTTSTSNSSTPATTPTTTTPSNSGATVSASGSTSSQMPNTGAGDVFIPFFGAFIVGAVLNHVRQHKKIAQRLK